MSLSAPIFVLKRRAKLLARQEALPLHAALDRLAAQEGYQGWSHLASAQIAAGQPNAGVAAHLMQQLAPGQMALLGARPGQGKTLLGLQIAADAPDLRAGPDWQGGQNRQDWQDWQDWQGAFFTLDYHAGDVAARYAQMGVGQARAEAVLVDTSDEICADYIIGQVSALNRRAVIVVDYLQLLDQRRSHPVLNDQLRAIKAFVQQGGHVCVMISQIDRRFDQSGRDMPDRSDIRLPNPVDLDAFDRFFFLQAGVLKAG